MSDEDQVDRLLRELRSEGITDPRVLAVIRAVPREIFVPPECRAHAFRNSPLPIGDGQTISQPFVVALMTEALRLTGVEKVLEIGTGSGYQCAVLAELSGRVISIERIEALATAARWRLDALGYTNVDVRVGDGSLGCPEEAPFDAIIVTAAAPRAPEPLLQQLGEGGRLVTPIGSLASQHLMLFRKETGKIASVRLGPVQFVPLVGESAWREEEVRRVK